MDVPVSHFSSNQWNKQFGPVRGRVSLLFALKAMKPHLQEELGKRMSHID